jgi:glycerol-1-phosphate dehydrogenase [NAD(P)+]
MEGWTHRGSKVAHGAAVAVGAVATLALFDWLLDQDLDALETAAIIAGAPDLAAREAALARAIADPRIAERAREELRAKHVGPAVHAERLRLVVKGWRATRERLRHHLVRREAIVAMLHKAGAPAYAAEISVSLPHLMATMRAAAFIRSRYTIFDFLHETGLTEAAFASVGAMLVELSTREASV